MESATRTAAITPERYTEVTAVFRPGEFGEPGVRERGDVGRDGVAGPVRRTTRRRRSPTAACPTSPRAWPIGAARIPRRIPMPRRWRPRARARPSRRAFLTRSHSLPFLTSSGMAFFTSSGSLPHASITTAKPGVGGISEHRRFCSCCADFVLVMLPGFDSCKAFSFPSSTGESFVRSCDCMGYASICPGFDRFCPGVNCAEMVEAAGIEPNTTH